MLSRRGLGASVAALLALSLGLVPAPAQATPKCTKYDDVSGTCTLFVEDPGGNGGDNSDNGASTTQAGNGTNRRDLPPGTVLVDGVTCEFLGPADPQPAHADPIWGGHEDGAIYECMDRLSNRMGVAFNIIQFWSGDAPAPPPPDPEDLARQAIDTMNLSAIRIGIVPEVGPDRVGVIGLPSWMWATAPDEHTIGPITRTASAGGFTVTATGHADKVAWNMGDGTTVTCTGPGTPYTDAAGDSPSPTCGHTYTVPGRYTVTATSYWSVDWSGIGQTGTIPLDFTQTAPITMGEVQVIVQ